MVDHLFQTDIFWIEYRMEERGKKMPEEGNEILDITENFSSTFTQLFEKTCFSFRNRLDHMFGKQIVHLFLTFCITFQFDICVFFKTFKILNEQEYTCTVKLIHPGEVPNDLLRHGYTLKCFLYLLYGRKCPLPCCCKPNLILIFPE